MTVLDNEDLCQVGPVTGPLGSDAAVARLIGTPITPASPERLARFAEAEREIAEGRYERHEAAVSRIAAGQGVPHAEVMRKHWAKLADELSLPSSDIDRMEAAFNKQRLMRAKWARFCAVRDERKGRK